MFKKYVYIYSFSVVFVNLFEKQTLIVELFRNIYSMSFKLSYNLYNLNDID